jgi:hypothetical protein
MLKQGFPAVRITEATENYERQHQNVRVENGVHYGDTPDGVDFPYLAKVTRLNVLALASMASAPPPPTKVETTGAVSDDTTVKWDAAPGAVAYRVWWRDTALPEWRYSQVAPGVTQLKLVGVNIDDWFFGVSSLSAEGWESPVVAPGVSSSFERLPPTTPPQPYAIPPTPKG